MDKKFLYDIKMANFFMMNGAKCIGTGINKNTGNTFWCFEKESCQEAYKLWNEMCKMCP